MKQFFRNALDAIGKIRLSPEKPVSDIDIEFISNDPVTAGRDISRAMQMMQNEIKKGK